MERLHIHALRCGLISLNTYTRQRPWHEPRPEIIKLDPQQVKILDALAEAADIPHQRGQAEIEIPEHIRDYATGFILVRDRDRKTPGEIISPNPLSFYPRSGRGVQASQADTTPAV